MSGLPANSEPLGARKRKAPIDDNGDPIVLATKAGARVPKKKKMEAPTTGLGAKKGILKNKPPISLPAKRVARQASVEEVFDERDHPPSRSPHNSCYIIEPEDIEEEENAMDIDKNKPDDEETSSDEEEEEEEEAEAELGMFSLRAKKHLLIHH